MKSDPHSERTTSEIRPIRVVSSVDTTGMYCPSSTGIKRSRREPNNSPVPSAEVMIHSTNFSVGVTFTGK